MAGGEGSGGRGVDGGVPGAARAGPEGAGVEVRGRGDRAAAGTGRPAAERAGDPDPARRRRDRVAPAGGRPWRALPAGWPPRRTVHGWFRRWLENWACSTPCRGRWRAAAAQGRPAARPDAGHHRRAGGEVSSASPARCRKIPLPHAGLRPAARAGADLRPGAEPLRQVAPGDAGAAAVQRRLHERAVVPRRRAHVPLAAREEVPDPLAPAGRPAGRSGAPVGPPRRPTEPRPLTSAIDPSIEGTP